MSKAFEAESEDALCEDTLHLSEAGDGSFLGESNSLKGKPAGNEQGPGQDDADPRLLAFEQWLKETTTGPGREGKDQNLESGGIQKKRSKPQETQEDDELGKALALILRDQKELKENLRFLKTVVVVLVVVGIIFYTPVFKVNIHQISVKTSRNYRTEDSFKYQIVFVNFGLRTAKNLYIQVEWLRYEDGRNTGSYSYVITGKDDVGFLQSFHVPDEPLSGDYGTHYVYQIEVSWQGGSRTFHVNFDFDS